MREFYGLQISHKVLEQTRSSFFSEVFIRIELTVTLQNISAQLHAASGRR